MRFFISLLLVLSKLLFVLPVSVNAQTNHNIISIEVCLNPENKWQLNPNLISDFLFQPVGKIQLNKETKHWLRITINNKALAEKENYLHFNGIFAEVTLWQKNDRNELWEQSSVGGYDIPCNRREADGIIEDKLLFNKSSGDETKLLVSVYQPYIDIILNDQCEVISKSKFEKENTLSNNLQFMFAGVIFILCLFSLVLFFLTRETVYLLYFLYALITEIYFLAFFNIVETHFLYNYPVINKYLFFCITLSQALYLWFLVYALKRNEYIKKQSFAMKYTIASSLVALFIIIFSLFGFSRAVYVNDIYTGINGTFVLIFIITTFKEVSRTIRIIFIGLTFMTFGGLLAMLLNFFSNSDAHVYFYQAGFFIELIFFTVVISYTYIEEKNSRIQTMLNLSVMEAKKLKTEKEALELKTIVDQKNRKLTLKAVEISKNNQLINKMIDWLGLLEDKGTISIKDITRLKRSLISSTKHDYWEEFEVHFIKVHPGFYELLNKKYPELTTTERRLCAFIKLNLTTKEIASITKRNPESIHMTRSRLRKKMGLDKTENLENVIAAIK